MSDEQKTIERIRAAWRGEPRIAFGSDAVALSFRDRTLTIDGEAASVAAKKLALEVAAALPEIDGIVDRLRVVPAQQMGDREILHHVRDALASETALGDCALRIRDKGKIEPVREPSDWSRGSIEVAVEAGVVTLAGEVPGLALKRLAGLLCWWVPGSRDVVNGLAVEPPENDTEAKMTDAVHMAHERDPFLDAAQIRVRSHNGTVLLLGLVPSEAQRDMAEKDAWYVFGVDRVENRIETRP